MTVVSLLERVESLLSLRLSGNNVSGAGGTETIRNTGGSNPETVSSSERSDRSLAQQNESHHLLTTSFSLLLREGTFFLGGEGEGGLGPQRGGSSVKVSTKRGGPYLM